MNEAISTLESKYAENENRLTEIQKAIDLLMQESETIKQNNGHLAYSINLIKNPTVSQGRRRVVLTGGILTNVEGNSEKKTLRATLLDVINKGETISVNDAWERVRQQGIETTRATVNTSLYNLVQRGYLVKPEAGRYKKVA